MIMLFILWTWLWLWCWCLFRGSLFTAPLSIVLVVIIIISISMYSWVRTSKVNLFTNFTKSLTIKQPFLRHNHRSIVLMMGEELSVEGVNFNLKCEGEREKKSHKITVDNEDRIMNSILDTYWIFHSLYFFFVAWLAARRGN